LRPYQVACEERLEVTLKELERGFELHEKRLERIEDNLLVQGELLGRLEVLFEESERQRGEDRERLRVMQAAMTSLFERMDKFIRGLERRDGHPKPGSE
jgi:hypothetical protein